MDWTNLLWLGAFVALFFVMMRGCGGMAGGCGMGARRAGRRDEDEPVRRGGRSDSDQAA